MKKIVQFIKYNNFFTISVLLILLGSGVTFAANPDTILSSKNTVVSIDNTYIRTVNLDAFNPNLVINKITEDPNTYYVDYSYSTIELKDSVWQPLTVQKNLSVNKLSLGGNDLGLYVSDQLGQLIDSQLVYLKEAQKIEIAKGVTNKVIATQYAGLIGSHLGSKTKIFNGYVPVIPPKIAEADNKNAPPPPDGSLDGRSQSIPLSVQIEKQNAANAIKKMVDDALKQQQQNQNPPTDPVVIDPGTTTPPTNPVVTDPGTTTPPTNPVVTDPGTTTPPVTPVSTSTPPTDPVVTDPGTTPPPVTPVSTSTPPTDPVTPPADTNTTPPPAVTTNDVIITPVQPDTTQTPSTPPATTTP